MKRNELKRKKSHFSQPKWQRWLQLFVGTREREEKFEALNILQHIIEFSKWNEMELKER